MATARHRALRLLALLGAGLDWRPLVLAEPGSSPEDAGSDLSGDEVMELSMYKQVRCRACKAVAELIAADMLAAWRPSWNKDSFLEHVQGFCESDSFPGEYQVVAKSVSSEAAADGTQAFSLKRTTEQSSISPISVRALRRVCRDDINDFGEQVAKESLRAVEHARKEAGDDERLLDAFAKKPSPTGALQHGLELLFCKRSCKSRRRKKTSVDRVDVDPTEL
uniref:DUF3456 domain-containing protein n=1 Tax=Alexandrium andersonii TaxID=327968 RepID=A0A7S2DEC0_9DINO|mmetsp:Transcript_52294/g.118089  ORF Transcript_52294/g.118089 Transcript_52294/m.118089 type:complete len:222 (+) Transcript_52294:134-799(+)